MKKVFQYCRKSTESEDRQVISIDSQKAELKKFADSHGLEIVKIFTESKSAKEPGRPIFNEMMARVYKGEVSGILCWKLDRLARNPVDGGSVIWSLKSNGIEIFTPSQTYTQDNDSVVMMYLEFGMAQKYIDDLSKNVKRGLRTKVELGWYPSLAPLGYINIKTPEYKFPIIANDTLRFEKVKNLFIQILEGLPPAYVWRKATEEKLLNTKLANLYHTHHSMRF